MTMVGQRNPSWKGAIVTPHPGQSLRRALGTGYPAANRSTLLRIADRARGKGGDSPWYNMNEATARIKINKLLERSGWRFFPEGNKPANVRLEPNVPITQTALDALGEDFEKTSQGFIDYLLLDSKGFPLLVLEAKSEGKQPLVGKEQARKYARSQNCRFVILSNGNLHYFWDLERGNPYIITSFPTPESVVGYSKVQTEPQASGR